VERLLLRELAAANQRRLLALCRQLQVGGRSGQLVHAGRVASSQRRHVAQISVFSLLQAVVGHADSCSPLAQLLLGSHVDQSQHAANHSVAAQLDYNAALVLATSCLAVAQSSGLAGTAHLNVSTHQAIIDTMCCGETAVCH
jgi:hypothetical protein